jgi:dienelactone hydrolase
VRIFQTIACAFFAVASIAPARAEFLKFDSPTNLASYKATIGGELLFPAGRGPFPVVIILHPCGGLDSWAKASLAAHSQALAKAGFATYTPDSLSARGLTAEKVCQGGGEAVEFRLDDLFNARDALEKNPKIDKEKFFVVGQSQGGSVALSAAASRAQIKPFRAIAAFYPGCRGILFTVALKSPVLVFSGAKDDWTPASYCEEAKNKERPSTSEEFNLIVYPNAYHTFDHQRKEPFKFLGHVLAYDAKATQDSRKKMVDFFVQHLSGQSSNPAPSTSKN